MHFTNTCFCLVLHLLYIPWLPLCKLDIGQFLFPNFWPFFNVLEFHLVHGLDAICYILSRTWYQLSLVYATEVVGLQFLGSFCWYVDGWIRLIVGFQPLMVISPTASWVYDYWTRLVLVRPAASLYSASPLKHHPTGKQWCPDPDHYSDSEPASSHPPSGQACLPRACQPAASEPASLPAPSVPACLPRAGQPACPERASLIDSV